MSYRICYVSRDIKRSHYIYIYYLYLIPPSSLYANNNWNKILTIKRTNILKVWVRERESERGERERERERERKRERERLIICFYNVVDIQIILHKYQLKFSYISLSSMIHFFLEEISIF